MAFNSVPIQQTFNRYQDVGRFGQLAGRDNGTFIFDTATAGVLMQPGQGVYLDEAAGPTQGQWIIPPSAVEEPLVTHVVGFDLTDATVPVNPPQGNVVSRVEYPAGTPCVKALANGSIFVGIVGATAVQKYEAVHYGSTEGGWIPGFPANSKTVSIALEGGPSGTIIPIRISRVSG